MGLFANIPSIEAHRSMEIARGIAVALGDPKMLAQCVFLTTGDGRLAQKVEINAMRERNARG